MWSRKLGLPARSVASPKSRRCRRTPVSTGTSAKAAGRFYDRVQATAACSARLRIRSARRSRPSPSRARGSSYPRREGEPSPRGRQAYESARGCTNEGRGPKRCAGRCTRADSRNADPTGCGAVRLRTRRKSTPAARGRKMPHCRHASASVHPRAVALVLGPEQNRVSGSRVRRGNGRTLDDEALIAVSFLWPILRFLRLARFFDKADFVQSEERHRPQ